MESDGGGEWLGGGRGGLQRFKRRISSRHSRPARPAPPPPPSYGNMDKYTL